ncbi:hypothetical protein DB346_19340 [Verrucomicrobia bacterium LW23]|nr:hypothetical protein DB346_19340 [Verrucomicrobia bacterium LW23]
MEELFRSPVGRLRIISVLEGISLLLLVGVAMPLKYGLGIKIAVTIAGAVHGGLFLLFLAALFMAAESRKWGWGFIGGAFLSCLLPFGFFWLEGHLRRDQNA